MKQISEDINYKYHKECKICTLPFSTNNAIRVYCDFHSQNQNKDVTDPDIVKGKVREQVLLWEKRRKEIQKLEDETKEKELVEEMFKDENSEVGKLLDGLEEDAEMYKAKSEMYRTLEEIKRTKLARLKDYYFKKWRKTILIDEDKDVNK